eukprot:TRINITY_DN33421_c0_g1_i1.p1 TRINITY_DN33421_c0_g1~~TRINITY_DN33421_c0_g1_i1.p1  ORF type:complete len:609 (-),score=79.22 TRINITY_DN33421_c0_g1_i1:242-2068(-)
MVARPSEDVAQLPQGCSSAATAAPAAAAAPVATSVRPSRRFTRGLTTETTATDLFDDALAALYKEVNGQHNRRKLMRNSAIFGYVQSMTALASNNNSTMLQVVQSPAFDFAVAIVIILNTSLVGFEQTYDLHERFPDIMLAVESVFLIIYLVELACRFRAFGLTASLREPWIRLDIILLLSGMLFTWFLSASVLESVPSTFTNLGVLRASRVLRLARMVRLVVKFQSLWMLMQGLLNSLNTMFSVLVVLLGVLYIFGCIGFDLIGKHELLLNGDADALFVEAADTYFSSLSSSMMSIFSFVAFDGVRQIYWPLVEQDPLLILYFVAVILTVGIVLANLVTAFMVHGALEQAALDKDAQAWADKRKWEERLEDSIEIFKSLDDDDSGLLTREEVRLINEKDAALLESLIHVRDPIDLFDTLDMDGSGEVDMNEFMTVIQLVSDQPARLEFMKLGKALKQIPHIMASENCKTLTAVKALANKVDQLSKALHADLSPRSTRSEAVPGAELQAKGWGARSQSDLGPGCGAQGRQVSFESGRTRLPESTPRWASHVYEALSEDLERSTRLLRERVSRLRRWMWMLYQTTESAAVKCPLRQTQMTARWATFRMA